MSLVNLVDAMVSRILKSYSQEAEEAVGGKASKKDAKAAKKGGKEEVLEEKETHLSGELKLAI